MIGLPPSMMALPIGTTGSQPFRRPILGMELRCGAYLELKITGMTWLRAGNTSPKRSRKVGGVYLCVSLSRAP